jgi:hypothetical protein
LPLFLNDARTHSRLSGAPVVMRRPYNDPDTSSSLPWVLLGVHSGRLDPLTRDQQIDEMLGLNSACHADILVTLTR